MANEIFPSLVGNARLKERLCADVLDGAISHAYIIEGPEGSGKHTLARDFAAALSCARRGEAKKLPCGECPSCKKILQSKSPDVIYVNRAERATLGVDSIRFIRSDVAVAPNDTDYKIYVIEDAHTMTDQAQNAFLLTLEEPPSYVLFLLLCDGAEKLLETVKSRAPILRMECPSESETKDYLLRRSEFCELSEDEKRTVLLASNGYIGAALNLLDKKKRAPIIKRREVAKGFVRACATRIGEDAVSAVTAFGAKRDEICECVAQISLALRDLSMIKKSDRAPLLFYTDREEAVSDAEKFNALRLMEISDCISDIEEMIARNANAKLIAMKLMLCAFGERT